VQESTTFSADFRIAKSYGGTPQNAFVQGGNAFGTTALLGTTDNQPLEVSVNGQRVMRFESHANGPNVIGGHPGNQASPQFYAQTIGGGGLDAQCFIATRGGEVPCTNATTQYGATVGGGYANLASGTQATVGGGGGSAASGLAATVQAARPTSRVVRSPRLAAAPVTSPTAPSRSLPEGSPAWLS